MRDYHEDPPYIVIERQSAGFGAFIWGALIGAGVALLLAPRSGAQTQEDIRQGIRRVRTAAESARDTVERTRGRIEEQFGAVRDQVESVRSKVDDQTERARDTLDAGRRAAREAREELQRRVSEVKDTYQSVAEKVGLKEDERAAPAPDVVITDVTEERIDGRSDLAG